jgi:effector-binding domain-containing protein
MIETPQITDTERQIAAVIHITVPRDQIQTVMEPAIKEVLAAISDQELTLAGPLFAYHLTTSPESFDFQVGFPVSEAVKPVGRVKAGALPATRVARTVYQGPYEGLFGAWKEFGQWIKTQDLERGGTLWERYVTGPETDLDPSTWRTELNVPVAETAR